MVGISAGAGGGCIDGRLVGVSAVADVDAAVVLVAVPVPASTLVAVIVPAVVIALVAAAIPAGDVAAAPVIS